MDQLCYLYTYSAASATCVAAGPDAAKGVKTVCVGCGGPRNRCCPGTKVGSSLNCSSRAGLGICAAGADGGDNMCVACGADGQPCCEKGASAMCGSVHDNRSGRLARAQHKLVLCCALCIVENSATQQLLTFTPSGTCLSSPAHARLNSCCGASAVERAPATYHPPADICFYCEPCQLPPTCATCCAS